MIIADFLQISINLIFVATIIVCILLLGIVLMQRPKQEGLGAAFGGALTDQAFGARTTDVLQKGTVYLGSLFMVLCFVFSLLVVYQNKEKKSTLGNAANAPVAEAPATSGAEVPATNEEAKEGVKDETSAEWIKKAEEAAQKQAEQEAAKAPELPNAPESSPAPAETPAN